MSSTPNHSSQPRWLSIAEASRLLRISETAVRKRIRTGALMARGDRGSTEVLISEQTTSQLGSQPIQSQAESSVSRELAQVASQLEEVRAHLADALLERDRWYGLAMEARAEAKSAVAAREALERELRLLLGRK